jgi:hypothetical protein
MLVGCDYRGTPYDPGPPELGLSSKQFKPLLYVLQSQLVLDSMKIWQNVGGTINTFPDKYPWYAYRDTGKFYKQYYFLSPSQLTVTSVGSNYVFQFMQGEKVAIKTNKMTELLGTWRLDVSEGYTRTSTSHGVGYSGGPGWSITETLETINSRLVADSLKEVKFYITDWQQDSTKKPYMILKGTDNSLFYYSVR